MKTPNTLLLLASLGVVSTAAQNAPAAKSNLQVQTGQAAATKPDAQATKAPVKPAEPKVTYAGALVDYVERKKPAKGVDLRSHPKPKTVKDNVYTDPQTGTVKGFVLFAIKF